MAMTSDSSLVAASAYRVIAVASLPCSARVRTTSRLTETPFRAPLISCAARAAICWRVPSQRPSALSAGRDSLTSLGVVRRRRDGHRLGRRGPVDLGGVHVFGNG